MSKLEVYSIFLTYVFRTGAQWDSVALEPSGTKKNTFSPVFAAS